MMSTLLFLFFSMEVDSILKNAIPLKVFFTKCLFKILISRKRIKFLFTLLQIIFRLKTITFLIFFLIFLSWCVIYFYGKTDFGVSSWGQCKLCSLFTITDIQKRAYFGHVNFCASNNKFSIPHCNFSTFFIAFKIIF